MGSIWNKTYTVRLLKCYKWFVYLLLIFLYLPLVYWVFMFVIAFFYTDDLPNINDYLIMLKIFVPNLVMIFFVHYPLNKGLKAIQKAIDAKGERPSDSEIRKICIPLFMILPYILILYCIYFINAYLLFAILINVS